jgi:dipeptidyl aminopeptidase/acylaminoacyl peptidase
MKRILLLVLLCLTWEAYALDALAQQKLVKKGNLVIDGIPEIPERIEAGLQQYHNIRAASLLDWLPSGEGLLIKTRFGETNQIHLVKRPGGARQQITFFREPVTHVWVSPDPEVNGFLFTKDVGGSELYQIFSYDLDTGEHRMLTDGESRNGDVRWSNRGDRFVFSTTRRNGRDWDLHITSIGNPGRSEPILEKGGNWEPWDWSLDDSRLLVLKYISINEMYLYLLHLETGELTPFNPKAGKVAYNGGLFSRDGRGIYFTSDQDSEFRHLRYLDLASGQMTLLTGDIPWDIGGFVLSRDGEHLAFVTNEDGIDRLHILNLRSGQEIPCPQLPMGRIHSLKFHPDGNRLSMVLDTPQVPGDVYVLHLASQELARWTNSETGGLRSEDFVVPELIRFATFDSLDGWPRTIPSFYYRPAGEGPFPVVIDIHGGPESQARPYFSARRQFWVKEMGIAVFRPNVRGSRGYGKSYLLLDNGYKREDSVRDIGALLDWIEQQPELDSDRVAVYGGSYGGYMVLASMVHYNDRLRAAIDLYGISNFVTFLENTKDYRRYLRRAEYGDERDPEMREFLERISPTRSPGKIGKPIFIYQGLNDPRVPVTESEQMVETIRKNGGEVWYLLAKDEGHGLNKKSNRDYFYGAAVLFLERYLLDDKALEIGPTLLPDPSGRRQEAGGSKQ